MSTAQLSDANLRKSFLLGADLMEAALRGTDLSGGAVFDDEDLEQQAKFLERATMPNGQKYEEWLKDQKAQGKDENNE